MKITHMSHSDISGGAARAAYRIHRSLVDSGQESRMWVNRATSGDWTVISPSGKIQKGLQSIRPQIGSLLQKAMKTENRIIHSPAFLPSRYPRQIENSDADVINLHWVNGEMISIAEIGRIKKPLVWTLHDMWAFSGAEHYTDDHRWRDGYLPNNRPDYESGFDLNRWVWQRKIKHWQRPIHIVTPSQWMGDCVQQSQLMRDWPVSIIPYPIDLSKWKPVPKAAAKALLGLPADRPIILFGAIGGGKDPRKGFDLLIAGLKHLHGDLKGASLLVFGQLAPKTPVDLGFPVHYTGHLSDDLSLRIVYSAADVMIIPSRQDNLPNTGLEAHSCGTPVVAFKTGGLPDIVDHMKTGYLAEPFDSEDLAHGIHWVLSDSNRHAQLSGAAVMRAEQLWSPEIIANQYLQVYKKVVENS